MWRYGGLDRRDGLDTALPGGQCGWAAQRRSKREEPKSSRLGSTASPCCEWDGGEPAANWIGKPIIASPARHHVDRQDNPLDHDETETEPCLCIQVYLFFYLLKNNRRENKCRYGLCHALDAAGSCDPKRLSQDLWHLRACVALTDGMQGQRGQT